MNTSVIKMTGCSVVLSLLVTSCAQIANDPMLSGLVGAGVGGAIGHEIGGRKGAVIGAGIGGLAGVAISYNYRANEAQKREAERRAQQALAKQNVRNDLKKKNARYVAVPVKRSNGQGGSSQHLMKVNAETGEPTGEVYVPKAGTTVSPGSTIDLGGQKALYYGSAIQGI